MLDTDKPTKIVLIGRYPPPFGGNTTHMERLIPRLIEEGRQVLMIDPYASAAGVACGERNRPDATLTLTRKSRGSLLMTLLAQSVGAVVHIHMSAGRNFY